MACASLAVVSTSGCDLVSAKPLNRFHRASFCGYNAHRKLVSVVVRASSDDADCNDDECAPDKEVGKVSVEWLAGEKTRVVGTFPPRKRGWTGYVEKDTAGQTNIYSIEPSVYVAESAISSGTAGSSSDGAENTAAIAAGLALIFIAGVSSVVLQVGKNPPKPPKINYSGPSLSYYINQFKPADVVPASVIPSQTDAPPVVETEEAPTVDQTEQTVTEAVAVPVQPEIQQEEASSTSSQ